MVLMPTLYQDILVQYVGGWVCRWVIVCALRKGLTPASS